MNLNEVVDNQAYVRTTLLNQVGTIEFFHPQSNSMPSHQLQALAEAIEEFGEDPEVKVIVLQSAGQKAFCAGASFDELTKIDNEEDGLAFFSGFAHVINAMRKAPKFVVVRVQGKTVGGGVGIAAAGDYTFATHAASIKLSELAVGIGPFVVGPAVERKIGLSAFSQLTVNATQFKDANWALEKGLYAEIFETIEEMDQSLDQLVQTLVKSSPEAMKNIKRIFWEGTENWDQLLIDRAKISGTLVLSDFTRNAIAAFKTK